MKQHAPSRGVGAGFQLYFCISAEKVGVEKEAGYAESGELAAHELAHAWLLN